MKPRAGILLAMALSLAAGMGCDDLALSRYSHNYGKVELVKVGMSQHEVVRKIGEPERVIRGEGLRINWLEMVYPGGSVFLYRMEVQKVITRSPITPMPEEKKWDDLKPFKDRNIFEGDGKPGAKSSRPSPDRP